MKLKDLIPKTNSFLPIVAGRREYQASIENPAQRDLIAYGEEFERIAKIDSEISEVKRIVMSGFFALALNPLAGLGVWGMYSYFMNLLIKKYNSSL